MEAGGNFNTIGSTGLPVIDVHAHHYPQAYVDACRDPANGLQAYVRDDGRLVVLQDDAVALAIPDPLPLPQQRLQAMDQSGIDVQVLSISAPSVYRFPRAVRAPLAAALNDEFDEICSRSDGRLRFLATLPLPDVDLALQELERVDALGGSVGVFLTTTIDRQTLDDKHFEPLFKELARRKTTVLVHPTTGCCTDGVRDYALALAIDFLAESTNCIARLVYSGALTRYEGINWVFSHLGGTVPFILHRFDNYATQFPECRAHLVDRPSALLRSVYFDTVSMHAPALRCAFETFEPRQFVFGSDYPHVPGGLPALVEALSSVNLSHRDAEHVAWRTAARLLGLREPRDNRSPAAS